MTAHDYGDFTELVTGLFEAHGRRAPSTSVIQAYWTALEDLSLETVQAGYCRLLRGDGTREATRCPTPAQWRQACLAGVSERLPVLPPEVAAAYREARAQGWTRPPCACLECRTHGVADRAQQFLPVEDAHGQIQRGYLDPSRTQVGWVGEWWHGARLARYYRAREAFLAAWHALAGRCRGWENERRTDASRL